MTSKGTSRSSRPDPKDNWWLGPVVIFLAMLAMILLFAVTLGPLGLARDPVAIVASQWVTYAIPFLIVYLHVRRFEGRKKFWQSVGVKREGFSMSIVWALALYVVFTAILIMYTSAITAIYGSDPQQAINSYLQSTMPPSYFVYMFIGALIPVALMEELLFRGFVTDRLLAKGSLFAIVVGALMFTSLHTWYASFEGGLLVYGGLFIISIWWAIVYWKTRNLAGTVLVHWWYNASLSVSYFWGISAVGAVSAGIFSAGMLCLGYLLFMWLRRLFIEIEQLVKA